MLLDGDVLPYDVLVVASANPEDYTSRGRIITPLKDRFGAQIRTHYPLDAELEAAVVKQEARPLTAEGLTVHGREVYVDLPFGQGRSPLIQALAPFDDGHTTTRNWRTVLTLADMSES